MHIESFEINSSNNSKSETTLIYIQSEEENKMSDIQCSAPDCIVSWPASTPPEVLIRPIDLHARTAHPMDTPEPAPAATGAKAEKVRRLEATCDHVIRHFRRVVLL